MRFQQRDGEILRTIYKNQGVMSVQQIKSIFWNDKGMRAVQKRLLKLVQSEYLDRPNNEQYSNYPIPEPICWLGWRGAMYIAGKTGISTDLPTNINETYLRELKKELKDNGINWVREPRWSLLRHDLVVTDFKLSIENEIIAIPKLGIKNWVFETEFRSDPDLVTFEIIGRDRLIKHLKKRILPDAYFEIMDKKLLMQGKNYLARFLLEIDMSTHDNPSFGRDKVIPGKAYIFSPAYRNRFGCNSGRWLVITNGQNTRLKNLMKQTQDSVGKYSKLFFFTTLSRLINGFPLTSPIWEQVGCTKPLTLFER